MNYGTKTHSVRIRKNTPVWKNPHGKKHNAVWHSNDEQRCQYCGALCASLEDKIIHMKFCEARVTFQEKRNHEG